jgi:hypothetical protein
MSESVSSEYLFVSYSSEDKTTVDPFISDLERHGLRVWIDRNDLPKDTADWQESIRGAIRDTLAVLLVATPNSRKSPVVYGELEVARTCHPHARFTSSGLQEMTGLTLFA